MYVIEDISENIFSLDGVPYYKNYISKVIGSRVVVYNCYDNSDVLIELTSYADFSVNGNTFSSAIDLQAALIDVCYVRTTAADIAVPDATATVKGKIRLAGDLSGTAENPTVPGLATAISAASEANNNANTRLPIETPTGSGSAVEFSTDRVYGTLSSPVTGNLSATHTGAKFGVTVLMVHNSGSVPSFTSEFKKWKSSLEYVPGVVNFIWMVYFSSTNIYYRIDQQA